MPLQLLQDWINVIEKGDIASLDEAHIGLVSQFIASLQPHVATFVHRVPIQDVWRITPNAAVRESTRNTRVHDLTLLKYPPADRAGYGRANLPKASVLYGSFSRISPRLETKPRSGDLVTLTRWRLTPGSTIAVTPVVFLEEIVAAMPIYQPHFDRYRAWLADKPALDAEYAATATAFITRQFIKPVPPGKPQHYVVSATHAGLLLQDERIDAVIYPSVATALADVNIAIRPASFDAHFEPVEAEELMVTNVSPDGTRYHQTRTGRARQFEREDGRVIWDPTATVPEDDLLEMQLRLERG